MNEQLLSFATVADAIEHMEREVDDPCIDNYRVAHEESAPAMADYSQQQAEGCCGSFDFVALIQGKRIHIGCNYGH